MSTISIDDREEGSDEWNDRQRETDPGFRADQPSALEAVSDADVERHVRDALGEDGVKIDDGAVCVYQRIVVLQGRVASDEDRLHAGDVAWHARGVVEIINEIYVP